MKITYAPNGRMREFLIDGVRIKGVRRFNLDDAYNDAAVITLTFLASQVEIVQEEGPPKPAPVASSPE